MTNLIGQSFGRYHILEQIGEGGMAVVYKAYDTRLETDVAVKVIRTETLPQNAVERALKRFEREAKSLAKLTHPNIVKVTDYGEHDGMPYLVMPYLPGGTLKRLLGKPMPWREAVALLIPVAEALDYAHSQGMIHRDVKPSNILLTERGQPMLTDFGIAKIIDEEATVDLTGTGAFVGTPEYMAPEQVTAKTVDHRADIYSLGVVLYEMVTGRKPYQADTPMAVVIKQVSDPLPRPSLFVPGLPDTVEKVLLKALAKDPRDRYTDMRTFATSLESVRDDATPATKTTVQEIKESNAAAGPQINWKWVGGIIILLALACLIVGGLVLNNLLVEMAKGSKYVVAGNETATLVDSLLPEPSRTATLRATITPWATNTLLPTRTIAPFELQFEVMGYQDWQSTGFQVNAGDYLIIQYVSGKWSPWANGYFDADGMPDSSPTINNIVTGVQHASLIAKIGNNEPFYVGNNFERIIDQSGILFLRINDTQIGDNGGQLSVKISTDPNQ